MVTIDALQHDVAELHQMVQNSVEEHRRLGCEQAATGKMPRFEVGDYVLVARSEFNVGEKLALRSCGPIRIVGAVSDYVFSVEHLRNGSTMDIHGSRLKFFSDHDLDEQAILSHVLALETVMPFSRLLRVENTPDGIKVAVR